MMLRGDHDVFHSRAFRQRHPRVGVELPGIEPLCQRLVFGDGNLRVVHDPFAGPVGHRLAVPDSGRHRVKAPVDKHAEPRFLQPRQPGVPLLNRLRVLDGRHGMGRRRRAIGNCCHKIDAPRFTAAGKARRPGLWRGCRRREYARGRFARHRREFFHREILGFFPRQDRLPGITVFVFEVKVGDLRVGRRHPQAGDSDWSGQVKFERAGRIRVVPAAAGVVVVGGGAILARPTP